MLSKKILLDLFVLLAHFLVALGAFLIPIKD